MNLLVWGVLMFFGGFLIAGLVGFTTVVFNMTDDREPWSDE